MSDDIEELRREIEHLKREFENLKREKEQGVEPPMPEGPPGPPPPQAGPHPRPPQPGPPHKHRHVHPPPPVIDLGPLIDGLDEMMEGIGEQIRLAVGCLDGVGKEIRIRPLKRMKGQRPRSMKSIQAIPPERIARVVDPLGNVDRLRILDYLRNGGKSFNELEQYIGKTGSSLTHHLTPLLEAGYIIKGEVRGMYYITVMGRLAYKLAQWLTYRLEKQEELTGMPAEEEEPEEEDIDIEFSDEEESE